MSENASGEADSGIVSTDKGFACPTCGNVYDTKMGVKQHHAKYHGESLCYETVECRVCGTDLTRRTADIRAGKSFQCGGCSKVSTECAWCGETLERHRSELEDTEREFCGGECYGEWLSKNHTGEDHARYATVTITCDSCGSEIERQEWQAEKGRNFCDKDCHGEWLSDNVTGHDHPNYKGGYDEYYGPNWISQRQRALERDNFSCISCGATEETIGRRPDVHHVRRLKWYKENYDEPEWYERANRLENLITLCPTCHARWEGIPLKPDNR